MNLEDLVRRGEEAFRSMDWREVVRINRKILNKKPAERIKKLSTGFYHYAQAKLCKKPEEVILHLDKAYRSFREIDFNLAVLAQLERMILLAETDGANRGKHLKALGVFTQDLFVRTGDSSHLQLAVKSFEELKSCVREEEIDDINKNLVFCYARYAPYSSSPGKIYRKLLKLCEDMERGYEKTGLFGDLARTKINSAVARQNLAALGENTPENLKTAIKLNEDAVHLFEKTGSKPEIIRAKQSLANILCDAAFHGIDGKENLKGAVQLRKEGADMFLADGYELNYACEALDIGVMYLELASGSSSKEHLKNALEYLNKAVAIFERENRMIDLGNAKMGIAVVYRNQSNLKKAIETYKEAITIFEKGNNPRYTGHAKLSLAGVYRELSRGSSRKNLKQAEKLEKEAAELLK